ncbi:MAG: T9SS type A sorting domain-containing protein [Prevotellaceae bacterium]|nr:T9SS type A sorting domain-containing protein [Prevotellaceae bacterium]
MCFRTIFAAVFCLFFVSCQDSTAQQPAIRYDNGNIILKFSSSASLQSKAASQANYTVWRSKGRFGNYQQIGVTSANIFSDLVAPDNPYDYYYKVFDQNGTLVLFTALDIELFGENMYFYSPEDDMTQISIEINGANMIHAHYSDKRFGFNFKSGDYTAAGSFDIGFYTNICGLGALPTDVKLFNVKNPPHLSNNNVTQNFWRSAENFSIQSEGDKFMWSVSQAAPLRRVYSNREVQYDWSGGWASGGFTADCYFTKSMGSYSQQQYYTRNTFINFGSSGFNKGNWNTCYQGIELGPNANAANHNDNWQGTSGGSNVSRVELTPVIREKPFLFIGNDGKYKVFRPALRYNSMGASWSENSMGAGTVYDIENDFYVVKKGTTAAQMNAKLAEGKHLFITPAIYELSEPLHITHPNTIVLGTGYATFEASAANNETLIKIDDVDGVTVAGLLLETKGSTQSLMVVGQENSTGNHCENPTLLSDLFFRVGGYYSTNVNTDIALKINSNDVIGDHFWIWRADHGSGVGWARNTSKNGLIVNGHDVTIYGLFNEHFQEYGTIWYGERGRVYFYQNETPYDVASQAAYMSHNGTVNGWSQFKVDDNVNHFYAAMLGMYDVLTRTGGNIIIENSMEVPDKDGIHVHHICNVHLSGNGKGFRYILNGQVESTLSGTFRKHLVDYVGTQPSLPFEREVCSGETGLKEVYLSTNLYTVSDNILRVNVQDSIDIVIYSVLGKKMVQTKNRDINISSFPKGVYILAVGRKAEKFVR